MKFVRLTIAVLTMLAGGALFAQRIVQANVPFDFFVGDSKLLPAGTYRLFPCGSKVIQVQNCTDGTSVLHVVYNSGVSTDQRQLLFHKYGNTYFLRGLKGPDDLGGFALLQSRHEKKVLDEWANVTTYETIEVPKPEPPNPPKK